jgi:hypothetical protein
MPAPPINRELDVANLEDICHLSSLWEKEALSNADIRNSSHITRRLLVYGDLVKSAASRRMRMTFVAADNSPFIKSARNGLIDFWQSGGTTVLGVWMRGAALQRTPMSATERYFAGWNPEMTVELRLDSFMRQEVFGYMGRSATRQDVITYMANKAGGPHFDSVREDAHETLDRIRSGVTIKLENDMPSFAINPESFVPPGNDFVPAPNSIDPVFIELAATCRYLAMSPAVKALAETLRSELGR